MDDNQLDTIRKRWEAAADGPWYADRSGADNVVLASGAVIAWCGADRLDAAATAEAVAHARTDVPALLTEVDRLRAELTATNDDANKYADRVCDLEGVLRTHGLDIPA